MGTGTDWHGMIHDHFLDYNNVTVDLPGHGRCRVTSEQSFTHVLLDLFNCLRRAGIKAFIPIGYSMGGRFSFHLQQASPQMIPGMVFLSSAPGLKTDQERRDRLAADDQLMDRLGHIGFDRFIREWYESQLFGNLSLDSDLVSKLVTSRSQNDPEQLRINLSLMGNGALPSLWPGLEEITCPCLLLTGESDSKYTELNVEMAGFLPISQHQSVVQGGHAFHLEKPLETAGFIRHFLSKSFEGA